MKLNNLTKNAIITIIVLSSILAGTLLWPNIYVNFSNITNAAGQITEQNYSTDADTIRYIVFIMLPLVSYLVANLILKPNEGISFKKIIYSDIIAKSENSDNRSYYFIIVIFILYVFLEFLSLPLPDSLIDTFHDGELLSPANNAKIKGDLFLSSYTIHGASDMLYPLFFWNIFGTETVGAGRSFFYFITLALKVSSIFLSYQLTKLSKIDLNHKKIFFIFLTVLILSMSKYQVPINFSYFSYRDIFVILFLIFFIEIFKASNYKKISHILISFIASISLFLHIDTGIFLNILILSYIFYLLLNKKKNYIFIIILSIFFSWLSIIFILGFEEIKLFFYNAITIVLSMDYLHGIRYPDPFFSIGNNPDGARATRGVMLQLIAGLFVLHNILFSKNMNEKIFFIFLFFLSFIMYKNALGRSDSYHIRMSNDLPILIVSYFSLKQLLAINYFKKVNVKLISIFIACFFLTLNYKNINFYNIINVKKNYNYFIKKEDSTFLKSEVTNFVKYYKNLIKNEKCIVNFTDDLILPYLLKKPTCSKFVLTWLGSPTNNQKKYIQDLQEEKPKFIIYDSPEFKVDGISSADRLKQVNTFILKNYKFYEEFEGYKIFILKIN